MTLQPTSYDTVEGLLQWLIAFGGFALTFLLVALTTSFPLYGFAGPARVFGGVARGFQDFIQSSPRRILAISILTFKESVRRKALLVFVIFAVLFMFAGWFIEPDAERPELHLRNLVVFVFRCLEWLILPVIGLLACWGIPEDIRLRSLHTVVTKPVRRNEVVMGRMLGFAAVGSLIIAIMSVVGYGWILRHATSDAPLFCRVPVYGSVGFIDRVGNPQEKGVNVGDMVEIRSFIEGRSKAAGIWRFPISDEAEEIRLESRFEAFRTWKGRDMRESLKVQYTIVNTEKDLSVPLPEFQIREFGHNETLVNRKISFTDQQSDEPVERTVDLFDDLASPMDPEKDKNLVGDASRGVLEIRVQCLDGGQYIGVSRGDFFIRMPDRSFAVGYFKSILGLWLTMVIIVMIGVTASCFVKWPVATLLNASVVVIGTFARGFLDKILSGEQIGGGALESFYRLITFMNEQQPLPESGFTWFIQQFDSVLVRGLLLIKYIFPDMRTFGTSEWVAKGFDVPWDGFIAPSVAISIGYIFPCILLGYYSLSLRELEAK